MSNFFLAFDNDLHIIPVLNKVCPLINLLISLRSTRDVYQISFGSLINASIKDHGLHVHVHGQVHF